jgi:hypothetical protein
MNSNEPLLTPDEVTRHVNRSAFTLKRWRREGTGPRFVVIHGRPMYDPTTLREWIASHLVSSNSEARQRGRAA